MANLVELDLLRGGQRLPVDPPLKAKGHFAFVTRHERASAVEAYGWSLRDSMPSIPIPLANDDEDVTISLQELFTTVYDRAGYDYSLQYNAELKPSLEEADEQWVREKLQLVH